MSKLANIEYSKLDNIITKHGKDFVVGQVLTRIAEGDAPKDIAHSFGVHYVYLKKWLEHECGDEIDLAKRAYADILMDEAVNEARDATSDDICVSKLKVDTYMKIAGKMSRREWGDEKASLVINNNVGVDASLVGFAADLLLKMRVVGVQEPAEGFVDIQDV